MDSFNFFNHIVFIIGERKLDVATLHDVVHLLAKMQRGKEISLACIFS